MAYCRKCGKLLSDSANHCTVCGAPVSSQPDKFDTGRIPSPQQIARAQEEIRVGHRATPQDELRVGHRAQPQEEIRVGRPAQPQRPPQNSGYGAPTPLQPLRPLQPVQQPVRPQEPPKKQKKSGGLVALYIILGVLILALLGAGVWFLWGDALFGGKNGSELGRYEVVTCIRDGQEAETDGEYIILRKKGKGVLSLEESLDITWKLKGTDLTVTAEKDVYTGTLEGDTLTLEVDDCVYTFEKETVDTTGSGGMVTVPPATTKPKIQDRSWWSGDWYGWWTVLEGEGTMYLMEGAGWDVCAQIGVTGDTATLHIWDEHTGEEQNVWFVDAAINDGSDDRGILEATGGTFRGAELAPGDLGCDPAALPYGGYQDLICITGVYTDPADPANTCTYCIFLRPWGAEWEDLRAVDPAMPYPDMLPLHYNDWYLPLIRNGGKMPAAFDF